MAVPEEFYLQQAALSARSASETDLPNLRDKYLRSQAAWEVLARREVATRTAREKREADKAMVIIA